MSRVNGSFAVGRRAPSCTVGGVSGDKAVWIGGAEYDAVNGWVSSDQVLLIAVLSVDVCSLCLFTEQVDVLDTATGAWTSSKLPHPSTYASVTSVGDKIFVVGKIV